MKFPSVQQVISGLLKTLNRFPFEAIISLFGTIVGLLLIEADRQDDDQWQRSLWRLLAVSVLALSLTLATSLYAEAKKLTFKQSILYKIGAAIFIVAIYFMFMPIDRTVTFVRFGLLFVCFHLLVSFSPFIHNKNVGAFWEFNKQIFIRILTSVLYSGVLFIGLVVAISSSNVLFNLQLDGRIYAQLWIVIVGIFNTIFFLAGVPNDWELIDREQTYPKGLKIFTQYVLIPLATIYLCILLSYELKIILNWSLPKGLVSWLILGYAVYGILSVLLIYPIRNEAGNRWINIFSRMFYLLLIPLIVLLAIAITVRVNEYGITEHRYILIALGAWLAGITIYFLTRKSNIKAIPISLCILALLSTWGPQSAGSISKTSQANALISFFKEKGSFKNGKLLELPDSVKTPTRIYEIPEYLITHFERSEIQQYFAFNLDSLVPAKKSSRYANDYNLYSEIRNKLKMNPSNKLRSSSFFQVNVESDTIGVVGYQYMIEFNFSEREGYKYFISTKILETTIGNTQFKFDMTNVIGLIKSKANNDYYLNLSSELSVESQDKKAKLIIKRMSIQQQEEGIELTFINGRLLVK